MEIQRKFFVCPFSQKFLKEINLILVEDFQSYTSGMHGDWKLHHNYLALDKIDILITNASPQAPIGRQNVIVIRNKEPTTTEASSTATSLVVPHNLNTKFSGNSNPKEIIK